MIGCLRTRVRKQPIIALYFEPELVLKFYNLEARYYIVATAICNNLAGYVWMRNQICVSTNWWNNRADIPKRVVICF